MLIHVREREMVFVFKMAAIQSKPPAEIENNTRGYCCDIGQEQPCKWGMYELFTNVNTYIITQIVHYSMINPPFRHFASMNPLLIQNCFPFGYRVRSRGREILRYRVTLGEFIQRETVKTRPTANHWARLGLWVRHLNVMLAQNDGLQNPNSSNNAMFGLYKV